MTDFITNASFDKRLRSAVTVAWAAFSRKVGGGLVPVNKEASMQLQYAFVLKQILPLAIHHPSEWADVELETGVRVGSVTNNIDILLKGTSPAGDVRIAIELKCYRTIAASGGTRGAHDIFMKDVYEDLHVLEEYVRAGIVSRGVALVMNDLPRFVQPNVKIGKCWAYDISHGFTFQGGKISVPVGGKKVNVDLRNAYSFNWEKFGSFWFAEVEGAPSSQTVAVSVSSNV
jgi:hypothetical protein